MAESSRGKLAIVTGGGPAPGINGVISSVTIEAINQGLEVVGFTDGFKNLVLGDASAARPLTIPDVAPYYHRGGSILGTSRTNPAKKPEDLARVISTLQGLGVKYLVTVGGDDTAFGGSQVYKQCNGAIKVAHVPKTIDNDLPLPPGVPTFGFETARHYGVQVASNVREDAKTTTRWYLIVCMGRAAGHLALGVGKASAATVTIIAEEFRGKPVTLKLVCDILIGSMIKRKAQGRGYGLAILSEGLLESIGEDGLLAAMWDLMPAALVAELKRRSKKEQDEALAEYLGRFGNVERDAFGHLRLGEIEFGRMVRALLSKRLDVLGLKTTIVDKDLGYELRCADPIPFDAEYTRNLGYGAVKFLLSPESDKYGAIVSFLEGKLVPLKFEDMINPKTQRMRPRLVDVDAENYECARRYMIRLEPADFADGDRLQKLAAVVKLTPEKFREEFGHVVE
ncbi:MAG: diphosphate--fructose-6-phosphate 1-phosphotransferase [Gemmataceae bacterium]